MRGFFVLILICLFFVQNPADAFFIHKKDYKQIFIQDALNAEKRNNDKSAFHSFEKAMYYYKKDKKVIEAYAGFCERRKYFDKSEMLYEKLYVLTKDQKYLFKKNLSAIKSGTLSHDELTRLANAHGLNSSQKIELNLALIYHFSYKNDWNSTIGACKKIPLARIDKDSIVSCIVASQRLSDKKYLLDLYQRFSEINPKNTEMINKILSIAEKSNNYALEEKYLKKFSQQNPNDVGIKYRLAGFYEKTKNWHKALKIYENLIAAGDTSEHVKSSLVYVKSQLNPSKQSQQGGNIEYKPKPLTGYKLQEKEFYDALDKKSYSIAMSHLQKMLKEQPKNTKLLKHKADISFATENYSEAIVSLEKIKKIKSLSDEEELFLAFLYSKEENYTKSLEIIDKKLQSSPKDEKLLNLALDYSMAAKDWDRAMIYNQSLLAINPNSEKFLKNTGDLYSIKKDFPSAIKYYEKLIENYPKTEYEFALSNFYMANQDFAAAQTILEPIYNEYGDEPEVVKAYLNSLLAQQKLRQAYWVIKTHHLEKTKDGYMVIGDMAMMDKNYEKASINYKMALDLEPEDLMLQNKLADSYRMSGYINSPSLLFKKVLEKDPKNLEARLGLGSLETDKKNFEGARGIFNSILKDNPNYRPAKIAIANSYIANDDKLSALDILNQISEDDESKLMKAKVYYDMKMWSDSKNVLRGTATKEAEALKYKIRRDDAITITPSYSFFIQQLADEFRLNYHRFGLEMSKNVSNNTNVFMDYNVIIYSSGSPRFLNNVVNEFKGGVQSRPNKKWEYRADLGVKAFEFGGGMIIADSWIKRYFSDKFALKVGYKRNNIEQSYTSAVGQRMDGVFTGRACDNKFYFETQHKLPYQIYAYSLGSVGFIYAQNLPTNDYFEAMLGAGKILYNNPKNKWINTFSADIISYNSSYQFNLLKLYDHTGQLFGGYFSPAFFSADTLNLKMEGNIKQWRLKYGIKAFGGIQTAMTPDQTTPTWGFSPYITYDINDNVAINLLYSHTTYADLVRDYFMASAVIRGFKKHAKN